MSFRIQISMHHVLPDCSCALPHHLCSNLHTVSAKMWHRAFWSSFATSTMPWPSSPCCSSPLLLPSFNPSCRMQCRNMSCPPTTTMAIHQQVITISRTSMINTWTVYSSYHKQLRILAALAPRFSDTKWSTHDRASERSRIPFSSLPLYT